MTTEERKERRIILYPLPHLKAKVKEYSSFKNNKNNKPQSDAKTTIEALNFFFKWKDRVKE